MQLADELRCDVHAKWDIIFLVFFFLFFFPHNVFVQTQHVAHMQQSPDLHSSTKSFPDSNRETGYSLVPKYPCHLAVFKMLYLFASKSVSSSSGI